VTSDAPDGTIIGVATIEKSFSENIKGILQERDIPELRLPASLKGMSFAEKLSALKKQTDTITASIEETTMQLDSFTLKWGAIYKNVREWAEEKLSVLKASASVFETKMCFIINGWMASADADSLREKLNKAFSGRVILEELEIKEEDIGRIPVILRNPAYFRPFEIFTKILPLPQYSSYDPTPFIAVFFPVFFGMILGDAGYGAILAGFSLILLRLAKHRKLLADVSKILFLCSMNALFFGLLYGEFLGDLGERLFGMYPLLIERRTAIMPMLYFSVTVGIVHIIIGIVLGFLTEVKKRSTKTAIFRLLHIILILCMLALFASLFGVFPALLTRPIVLAILILTPLILFTGGLLAPLEILKSIGNMISYARIMAIGLTSVLLAYTANRLAGLTGDVVVGVAAAALLHIINLILSVFSPAVHSLRLHYVEFFSKFIETGGEEFRPFKKKNKTSK
jgi:V/A-type H+-transporting ATPase subunit I